MGHVVHIPSLRQKYISPPTIRLLVRLIYVNTQMWYLFQHY